MKRRNDAHMEMDTKQIPITIIKILMQLDYDVQCLQHTRKINSNAIKYVDLITYYLSHNVTKNSNLIIQFNRRILKQNIPKIIDPYKLGHGQPFQDAHTFHIKT